LVQKLIENKPWPVGRDLVEVIERSEGSTVEQVSFRVKKIAFYFALGFGPTGAAGEGLKA